MSNSPCMGFKSKLNKKLLFSAGFVLFHLRLWVYLKLLYYGGKTKTPHRYSADCRDSPLFDFRHCLLKKYLKSTLGIEIHFYEKLIIHIFTIPIWVHLPPTPLRSQPTHWLSRTVLPYFSKVIFLRQKQAQPPEDHLSVSIDCSVNLCTRLLGPVAA